MGQACTTGQQTLSLLQRGRWASGLASSPFSHISSIVSYLQVHLKNGVTNIRYPKIDFVSEHFPCVLSTSYV